MLICLTGERGFLGRAVARRLRVDGHEVYGLSPTGDIVFKTQTVIHCAGEMKDYRRMYQSNVVLTQRVLDAAREANAKRFIFISSLAVTRLESGEVWKSYYAWSKWGAEQMVKQAIGIDTHILRFPAIYGGSGWRSWPVLAVKTLCKGRDPRTMRSLEDVVEEIVRHL